LYFMPATMIKGLYYRQIFIPERTLTHAKQL
jgi:hypothetical protein